MTCWIDTVTALSRVPRNNVKVRECARTRLGTQQNRAVAPIGMPLKTVGLRSSSPPLCNNFPARDPKSRAGFGYHALPKPNSTANLGAF